MIDIYFYTTHCPQCEVLKSKLDAKNIPYVMIEDIETIKAHNIMSVPVLEIQGERKNFSEAISWVNEQENWN